MNEEKFQDCLDGYIGNCKTTNWVNDELYKFLYANWLNKKVQLKGQKPEVILQLCKDSQKQDFAPDGYATVVRGVQFLWKSGRETLKDFISISDVDIFIHLAKDGSYDETLFVSRGMSYTALSGWLGTLMPDKFIPVPITDFNETIKFLFDLESYPKGDYKYFIQAQEHFKLTKEKLKEYESDLRPLYFDKISEYLKAIYPTSQNRKSYKEFEWNWLTEDFHLYIFRNYLKLYQAKGKKQIKQGASKIETATVDVPIEEQLEIYGPQPIQLTTTFPAKPSEIEKEEELVEIDYLERHRKQIEIGEKAETEVYVDEKEFLIRNNKADLSAKVKIVSADPQLGFDILSYELDGREKQIEVKAISQGTLKSFFISSNELKKSKELGNYYIYCVQFKDGTKPVILRLANPNLFDAGTFKAEPVTYKISFN